MSETNEVEFKLKLVDDRDLPARHSKFVNLRGHPTQMIIVLDNDGKQKLVPVEEEEGDNVRCRCHHYNGNGGRCHYFTCRHTPANHYGFVYGRRKGKESLV